MKAYRIAALCALAVLLTLPPQSSRAQDDNLVARYKARYVSLYNALVQNSDDIVNLIALSDFYADTLNPMHNPALAMDYIARADVKYTALLQDGKRFREANRMVAQGVSVNGIRQRRQTITEQTLAYLMTMPRLTRNEIEYYVKSFGHDPAILQQLNQLKVDAAYRNATEQQNSDVYYSFLNSYGGTAEADSAEARVSQQAIEWMNIASTEAQVDDIARRYPKSTIVQRAAEKRKGRIAFLEACNRHTLQGYRDYLSRYPSADDYLHALDMIDTLTTEEFYLMFRAQEYVNFIQAHTDNPLADKAMRLLRQRIEHHHDSEAARLYLETFPLDMDYNRLYQLYYSWHAAEGNRGPVDSFAKRYPDFPWMEQLRNDREQGVRIDDFDLMRPYRHSLAKDYASFVRMNTGKSIVFVALQRMMQNALDAKRWTAALQVMQEFELSFESDNQKEYQQLKQLVETASSESAVAEAPADTAVSRPVPHPDGIHLFFCRNGQIHQTTVTGDFSNRWTEGTPLPFAQDENHGLELFCLYDAGTKMLVGRNGDILEAYLTDGVWQLGGPLPSPVNTPYWETDAYMLADGSGILLASDRPGGCNVQASRTVYHGDTALATDLYFIPYNDGCWDEAIHLDVTVNTPYCERYPVISGNSTTLYFVSDGRGGMGYGDIYRATRLDDSWRRWSEPVNLGRETNSAHREGELALSADESRLFFLSDRGGTNRSYSTAARHRSNGDVPYAGQNGLWNLDNIDFHSDSDGEYITLPGMLESLVRYLKQHPDSQVDIRSHYTGDSPEKSYGISLQRGEAVRRYLMKRGIARQRVRVSAYGSTPSESGNTLEARVLE